MLTFCKFERTVVHKISTDKVKNGDLLALIQYVKVTDVQNNGEKLRVLNLDDGVAELAIEGKELIENGFSADQYSQEIIVSKSEAAQILLTSANVPLTVCFDKLDGSERTIRGRFVYPETVMGRSMVEDLDIADKNNRLRSIDHRTIHWIIVQGCKYTVKGK